MGTRYLHRYHLSSLIQQKLHHHQFPVWVHKILLGKQNVFAANWFSSTIQFIRTVPSTTKQISVDTLSLSLVSCSLCVIYWRYSRNSPLTVRSSCLQSSQSLISLSTIGSAIWPLPFGHWYFRPQFRDHMFSWHAYCSICTTNHYCLFV